MELKIESYFENIDEIEEVVERVRDIEQEYSCNCTLKLIRTTPCPDFQEFYKLPQ